jgi:hypothetical protein
MALWPAEATPAVATVTAFGRAFMAAMREARSLCGLDAVTLITGTLATVRNRCQSLSSVPSMPVTL